VFWPIDTRVTFQPWCSYTPAKPHAMLLFDSEYEEPQLRVVALRIYEQAIVYCDASQPPSNYSGECACKGGCQQSLPCCNHCEAGACGS
jgi:hypothetical protein